MTLQGLPYLSVRVWILSTPRVRCYSWAKIFINHWKYYILMTKNSLNVSKTRLYTWQHQMRIGGQGQWCTLNSFLISSLMDRQTDQPTNRVAYRIACMQTKAHAARRLMSWDISDREMLKSPSGFPIPMTQNLVCQSCDFMSFHVTNHIMWFQPYGVGRDKRQSSGNLITTTIPNRNI